MFILSSLSEKKVYASGKDDTGSFGNWCFQIEDVRSAVSDIKEDIENAQENYANLDWISKEQAIKIINKRMGGDLI